MPLEIVRKKEASPQRVRAACHSTPRQRSFVMDQFRDETVPLVMSVYKYNRTAPGLILGKVLSSSSSSRSLQVSFPNANSNLSAVIIVAPPISDAVDYDGLFPAAETELPAQRSTFARRYIFPPPQSSWTYSRYRLVRYRIRREIG